MKLKILILPLLVVSIFGCKQEANKKENSPSVKEKLVQLEKPSDYLLDWVNAINANKVSTIEETYATNAVKVISADSIISSSAQIADYYKTHKNKITSIESLFGVEANKERGINYELVKYTIDSRKEYIQIVIWSVEDEKVVREFEFTGASSLESMKVDTIEIAERRKLWMELCNSHNSENLVKQLYSPNTLYFNHKPIVQGTEDLIKEYDYMNNKNYSLNLHPTELRVVNVNLAFEIGQCSGSYNGKYILVWKKQSDGNWKIFIDSNI